MADEMGETRGEIARRGGDSRRATPAQLRWELWRVRLRDAALYAQARHRPGARRGDAQADLAVATGREGPEVRQEEPLPGLGM